MLQTRIKQAALSLLALSALLRIIVFLQNRTLFLDEANLSRNIVEKSYGALFGVLDYEQFAPPMYTVLVKFFVSIGGINEYSLRFFSLLLGFGSLYLFYRLAQKMFSGPGILYAIALFGFSIYMMRYQTENKQYAGDVFFTLLFLFSAWHYRFYAIKDYIFLGLAGAIAIWFSMPIVFSLAAIGAYLFWENLIKGKSKQSRNEILTRLSLTAGIWLISFGILFFTNLKTSLDSQYLKDFHKWHYLKLPYTLSHIKINVSVFNGYVESMIGLNVWVRRWAIFCILLGGWRLYKMDTGKFILILGPIVTCFVASMLGKYVLLPRISLFMTPIFMLLIGLGADVLFGKIMLWNNELKYVLAASLLIPIVLSLKSKTGIPYFTNEYVIATSRSTLEQINEHSERERPIFVIHIAKPTYLFYTQLYDHKIDIPSSDVEYGVWNSDLTKLAPKWKKKGFEKVWIYDSHTFGKKLEKLKAQVAAIGETEFLIDGEFGAGYLVKLK